MLRPAYRTKLLNGAARDRIAAALARCKAAPRPKRPAHATLRHTKPAY